MKRKCKFNPKMVAKNALKRIQATIFRCETSMSECPNEAMEWQDELAYAIAEKKVWSDVSDAMTSANDFTSKFCIKYVANLERTVNARVEFNGGVADDLDMAASRMIDRINLTMNRKRRRTQ